MSSSPTPPLLLTLHMYMFFARVTTRTKDIIRLAVSLMIFILPVNISICMVTRYNNREK